ncbi:MCE family protein [Mycobacterium sp. 94-17]|uniref:MCE family protein n=1 Tax=Mycobacterium sp. 94-17 TaxID=2986147 RepID=UPI002D1EC111|nr:MCE family protein [Mycobacterium sp. 94-17]MEB4209566.1 MCE family protein [Mycobacterium sp. 94-17]
MSRLRRVPAAVLRWIVTALLLIAVAGGSYLLRPGGKHYELIGMFSSAVGIYPGDDVRVAGVRVGSITGIRPQRKLVRITMSVRPDVQVPANAKAIIVSPNLVSARFIQLGPTYEEGPVLPPEYTLGPDRTGVPVEWDEIKTELTDLTAKLGPASGDRQGPVSALINQAADTFDGNGESFRQALTQLSRVAGRLSDSRTDLFGTVKNLQLLVKALSNSNEQIVQFSNRLASVSQVLADSSTDLDKSLGTLNQALGDVRKLLKDNNSAVIAQVQKLSELTKMVSDQSEDLEQVLHVAPNASANFMNMYSPAQGSMAGIISLPFFANPVQFICGSLESSGTTDYFRRAEICRERMGPVLKRIAVNYPPFIFHPINTITAYKGQVIYDTPETEAKARTPIPQLKWVPAPGATPPQVPADADISSMMLPPAPGPGPR